MSYSDRKASVCLQFVIVGGSIAGLACAYTLLSAGHRVVVIERSATKYQLTGSIRVPPNLTRILNRWGVGEALSSHSAKNVLHQHRIGKTGEQVGEVILPHRIIRDLGAESLFVPSGMGNYLT